MPFTKRHGVRLFWTDSGVDGPAVLLHTGGGGDGSMWTLAGYPARLAGRRVLLLDHRGRGRSSAPESEGAHRLNEYVEDVIAVLDDAGLTRCAFVGYSFGGSVGFRLAADHPDRVSALVSLGNVPESVDGTPDLVAERRRVAEVRRHGTRRVIEQMAAEESEPAPGWLVDNLGSTATDVFADSLEAGIGESNWADLHAVRCPTLLLWGGSEADSDAVEAARNQLTSGWAVRLRDYGHLQAFWHEEVAGPIVARFLDDVDPPAGE